MRKNYTIIFIIFDIKVTFDYKGKVFPIVEPKIVQVKELNSKISNYV